MKKLFAMFFLTMTVLFLGMGGYADANVSPSESSIAKSVKSSPIMNSMETVSGQLEYLSGDWYFMDGRYAFSVTGEKFNGCPVVTGYNFVGGTSFGAGIFRVEEASGLRDIPWSTKGEDAHSLLILNGNEVYRRTAKQQYQESIGGVYLGMTAQEVLAKLGAPPVAEKEETRWVYPEVGLAVEFETGVRSAVLPALPQASWWRRLFSVLSSPLWICPKIWDGGLLYRLSSVSVPVWPFCCSLTMPSPIFI